MANPRLKIKIINEIIPVVFMQPKLQSVNGAIGGFPYSAIFAKVYKAKIERKKATSAIKIRISQIILDTSHLQGRNHDYYKLPPKCVNSKAIPLRVGKGI
ncbi:MAG: hypothetical protein JXB43_00025 [Dehalococcoidia bacterium]|nr:hypothetical protein [Dehalococcoidia bacterium]